ncbi:MAG: NAD(P)/FAD-dependent oxidoreductase [Pseudomonadota bacterium]
MRSFGSAYRKHEGISGDYDAIVIGSGMGGMTAAALLARNGQRVLLLEQNNIIGGLTQSYSRDGYTWNTGLHYIGDVDSPAKFTRRFFDYLTEGKVEWAALPSIYNRMVIADRMYDIPAGAGAYRDALVNWFPDEVSGIDAYLSDINLVSSASRSHFAQKVFPEAAVLSQWEEMGREFHAFSDFTTQEALARYTTNAELQAVLCANWGDYSAPPSKSSYAMHCMLNKHYMDGGSYPVGGAGQLAETMLPVVEEQGGRVMYGAHVEEILVRDGAVAGVRLGSGEELFCDIVISNAGIQNTFGRLVNDDVRAQLKAAERLPAVTDTYALVGINIGLRGSAESLELEPANIWAHPGPDFDVNLERHKSDFNAPFPWSFITFPSAKDPSWEARMPNKSTIEMYAYTDYEHFSEWAGTRWHKRGPGYEELKNQVKERLLEQLCALVPSVRDAVDVVEVSTPLTYETFVCRERGGFMGIESNPDRFRQSWLRAPTEVEGLFLIGQDVTTDGVIGALMGGLIASSAVLKKDIISDVRAQTAN